MSPYTHNVNKGMATAKQELKTWNDENLTCLANYYVVVGGVN